MSPSTIRYAAAAVLLFSACSTTGTSSVTTQSVDPTAAPETTIAQTTVAQTTLPGDLASSESVCPAFAGPTAQIDWENLRELWVAADPMTPSNPTFENGDESDSVQFTFVDETIVQGSVDNQDGILTDLVVVSGVNPQDPFANMSGILEHWVALLTISEPQLEPTERVAILVALGVVGDNLSLIEMNGNVQCGPRTYEVVFDIQLAAFVLGVELTP